MIFDYLSFWSVVVTFGALALLLQAAALVRRCLFRLSGRNWWKLLIVLLPLVVSLWSFAVGEQAMETSYTLPLLTHLHLTPAIFLSLKAQLQRAIYGCVLQVVLIVSTYALTFLIENWAFPGKTSMPARVIVPYPSMRV